MKRQLVALWLFAGLSVGAVFATHALRPESPDKGFCGFVGPCVKCAPVSP